MNPFSASRDVSCLLTARVGAAPVLTAQSPLSGKADHLHSLLHPFILKSAFPCLLARSAFNHSAYRFGTYENAHEGPCVEAVAHDLHEFVQNQPPPEETFSTFIAAFLSPASHSEEEFETLLFGVLQQLNQLDTEAGHPWDADTSCDPDDPRFSFSFAGRSFFVVGLHGLASRLSRKFPYQLLTFNAHRQFDYLRMVGRFEAFQQAIRRRDEALQGNVNPALTDFGDDTEAKQYSGRLPEADWRAPLVPQNCP